MMKTDLFANVGRTFNKVGFQLKKHSPEILIAVGVVGTVASAVMACKATTKLGDILDESKEQIDKIHEYAENPEKLPEGKEYSIEDSKKDLTIVYAQTAWKVVKLYGPAVILGTASLGAVLTSNNILRQRNVALAAAYTAVEKGYKEYRGRVIERFGEEIDRELKYDIKAKQIEETVVDGKGKEKKVEKTVKVCEASDCGPWAKFFDETCKGWDENPEYSLMFLRATEKFANDRCIANGYLFVNDVYDDLGIERTKAGQVDGWIWDGVDPHPVDFGIYMTKRANQRFVNGLEDVALLDFNAQANIWSKM